MAQHKNLTRLTRPSLIDTQVTDEGLVHLNGLTQLTSLSLGATQVTDSGLIHLKGLAQLTSLKLRNTQINDAGLVYLCCFREVAWLSICEVPRCAAAKLEGVWTDQPVASLSRVLR